MAVKRYVEGLARQGSEYHRLLLQHGQEFHGRTRSSTVRPAARWKDRVKPRWHQCYRNAGEFTLAQSGAAYYEGYWSCSADPPVHHAWVLLDGHLLDFTGEDVDRRARKQSILLLPPAENEYLGVHVPSDFLRRRVESTRLWEPVSEALLTELGQHRPGGRRGDRR